MFYSNSSKQLVKLTFVNLLKRRGVESTQILLSEREFEAVYKQGERAGWDASERAENLQGLVRKEWVSIRYCFNSKSPEYCHFWPNLRWLFWSNWFGWLFEDIQGVAARRERRNHATTSQSTDKFDRKRVRDKYNIQKVIFSFTDFYFSNKKVKLSK